MVVNTQIGVSFSEVTDFLWFHHQSPCDFVTSISITMYYRKIISGQLFLATAMNEQKAGAIREIVVILHTTETEYPAPLLYSISFRMSESIGMPGISKDMFSKNRPFLKEMLQTGCCLIFIIFLISKHYQDFVSIWLSFKIIFKHSGKKVS